ncbi:MAG: transposase [Candidatus Moranbacteria bacterium]|nr:transposase [Candidatus Moranbacteria bacterium]
MPSIKVNKNNPAGSFFLTLTAKNWFYVFDRQGRWEIIAESLQYCQKNKGIKLFGFVFMLNHLHLIIMSEDIIQFLRSFKTFTSSQIHKNIKATEPSIEKIFLDKNKKFQLWKSSNMPKCIESEKFLIQKLEYIHNNPVRKQYVAKPEDWYWSSANPDCALKPDPLWES